MAFYGWVCVCFHAFLCVSVFFICQFSVATLAFSALIKRSWALEKRLIHPNRHMCPFPVSVYYAGMILLQRLPLVEYHMFVVKPNFFLSSLKTSLCQAKSLTYLRIFQIAEVLNQFTATTKELCILITL